MPAITTPGSAHSAGRRRANRPVASSWCRVLTTDFSPATERLVKRLFWNPAGAMLVAALVALLCGLVLSSHVTILAAGLFAVLGFGVLWPAVVLHGSTARFRFERLRCREGESLRVVLTVSRRSQWGASGLAVRGGFAPPDDPELADPVVAVLPHVAGRSAVELHWTFVPQRRGAFPLVDQAPRLVTGYPFGLRESRRPIAALEPLIVWPRVFPVGAIPDVTGHHRNEGNVSRSKVGQSGDVLGVRPYRRGDSPRRIHWSQTAKHDRLVVCELQSNARPRVQVVLDSDPRHHAGTGPDSSREWAIRIAASLIEGWSTQGAVVEAVIDGRHYSSTAGGDFRRSVLDALAVLPDDRGPLLADVLTLPVCRSFAEGVQVVVTTDRGLAAPGPSAAPHRRFFVLEADGFQSGERSSLAPRVDNSGNGDSRSESPPLVQPWVRVEGPGRVVHALRHGWKEASHGE